MRDKQVLNIADGALVGYVDDLEFDTEQGKILNLTVRCKVRGFSVFSKEEELIVRWEDIAVIGEDSVLIKYEPMPKPRQKKRRPAAVFYGGVIFSNLPAKRQSKV